MITLITESDPSVYSIWTDTGVTKQDGRCLATSDNKLTAILEAQAELRSELAMLIMLENDERQVVI